MAGTLAPPGLSVNTQVSHSPDADEALTPSHLSTHSNPFLTPTPSRNNPFLTPSNRSRASSVATTAVDVENALHPDPGTEKDFVVENNPFAFSPGQLGKLFNPKSLPAFRALGGLRGIERGLQTDVTAGLSVDETSVRSKVSFEEATSKITKSEGPVSNDAPATEAFKDRVRVYGKNVLPPKKATP